MATVLKGYQPEAVMEYFEAICQIPHGSYHEEKIAAYLCAFARTHGLWYREDALHNVFIKKEASAGYENEQTVLLQGHTDMVCVKRAGSAHDFTCDPLELYVEDGWLSAKDTTLGGDDGIAVAMMLAILADDTLHHPALECLFTVQEEVGLCGAAGFDYSDVTAKLLYNLDSEDEGVGTVSCAGGIRCDITRPVTFSEMEGITVTLSVRGLKGGHSGAEIHMPRGNAHRIVGGILSSVVEMYPIRLVAIEGGSMDNAIPRDCTAVFVINRADRDAVDAALRTLTAAETAVLSSADAVNGMITYTMEEGTDSVMSAADTDAVLALLTLTPNGVCTMCEDMPTLVESSCNMGILHTFDDAVTFGFLARSSVETRKEEIRVQLARCAKLCGADIAYSGAYPGWAYDKHSVAAARYIAAYERLFGEKPRIEAIHAGLECGLMKHAVPDIDPISIGPDMRDIHTPDERISLASVARVYETVCAMLAERAR